MDYALLLKIILAVISLISCLLWTVRKMYEAKLKKDIRRELTAKRGENGEYEVIAKGLSVSELTTIFRQLPIKKIVKEPNKPSLQLIKKKN